MPLKFMSRDKKWRMHSWRMDVAEKRDREWETWREFRACKSKLIHHDYLEAMQHAFSVEHKTERYRTVQIYPCDRKTSPFRAGI